jgi:2'-5' RNA ligase
LTAKQTEQAKPETKPAEKETKFSYGNTQAAVPETSAAYAAIVELQAKVADSDLAGKGKDVDEPHVTVRYGIQGDDTAGIRTYLKDQAPFEASLGKTDTFPPSPNSDGAAVVMVPVKSPELHEMNDEIQKHGDFKESDFKEYKPHVTVAYVKPEAAEKYKGMADAEGKTFPIESVQISDRDGNKETVKLEGKESARGDQVSESGKTSPTQAEKGPAAAGEPAKPEAGKPAGSSGPAAAEVARGTGLEIRGNEKTGYSVWNTAKGFKVYTAGFNREFAENFVEKYGRTAEAKPTSPAEKKPVKQPWEMTREEYIERPESRYSKNKATTKTRNADDLNRSLDKNEHRELVRKASETGKAIPTDVLRDYPEIKSLDGPQVAAEQAEELPIAVAEPPALDITQVMTEERLNRYAKAAGVKGWHDAADTAWNTDPELAPAKKLLSEAINQWKFEQSVDPKLGAPNSTSREFSKALREAGFTDEGSLRLAQRARQQGAIYGKDQFREILDIGRAIAKLGGHDRPQLADLAEAIQYGGLPELTALSERKPMDKMGRDRATIDRGATVLEALQKSKDYKPYPERPAGETGAEQVKRLAGRAPHEVTKSDWMRKTAYDYIAGGERRDNLLANHMGTEPGRRDYHEKAVKDALAASKPIPPEVLADYPELRPKLQVDKPAETPKAEHLPSSATPQEAYDAAVKAYKQRTPVDDQNGYNIVLNGLAAVLEHAGVESSAAYLEKAKETGASPFLWELSHLFHTLLAGAKGTESPAELGKQMEYYLPTDASVTVDKLDGRNTRWHFEDRYTAKSMRDYLEGKFGGDLSSVTAKADAAARKAEFVRALVGETEKTKAAEKASADLRDAVTSEREYAEGQVRKAEKKEAAEEAAEERMPITRAEHLQPIDAIRIKPKEAWSSVEGRPRFLNGKGWISDGYVALNLEGAAGKPGQKSLEKLTPPADAAVTSVGPDTFYRDAFKQGKKLALLGALSTANAPDEKVDHAFFTMPDKTLVAVNAHKLRLVENIYGQGLTYQAKDEKSAIVAIKGNTPVAVLMPMKIDSNMVDVPTAKKTMAAGGYKPEESKPSAGPSTTLHSGFLDPALFTEIFPSVADRVKSWAGDAVTPGNLQKEAMRETRGEKDRRVAIAIKQLEKVRKEWILRSRKDSVAFFNAVEHAEGMTEANLSGKDRALAKLFNDAFDKINAEIEELRPDMQRNYLENYFPHIWKQPAAAGKVIRNTIAQKRPFAGRGSFLKKRTIPTIQDGLDMGLEPASWNPVDLFLLKYNEMAQWLMGHQTLDLMKQAGTVVFVRPHQKPPDGWTQLDDRIGTVYRRITGVNTEKLAEVVQPLTYPGGKRKIPGAFAEDLEDTMFGTTIIAGHYYAPPDAAKAFNNFVSRGLAGRSQIYDMLQWANNNMNALQLGISAFHFTTTAFNASTSAVALGIEQLSHGKVFDAVKNLTFGLATIPSIAQTAINGSRLLREYLTPGSYAKFAEEANWVASAGGRAKMNTLDVSPVAQMLNAFRNKAILEGVGKIPATILHATVAPVMEFWVPRMKMGAFQQMAADILDRQHIKQPDGSIKLRWTEEELRRRMQRAWDSIDNRFGQLIYDNLFWHKALKDVLQLTTRSVGWNYGDVAELGGGVADTARAAGKLVGLGGPPRGGKGGSGGGSGGDEDWRPKFTGGPRGAEVTPRMAFSWALPAWTAFAGAVLTYLWTGHGPLTWKDYFYPQTKDGERHSIPGYWKDVIAFQRHPVDTVVNKMAPIWALTSQAIQNRDFYGTEIRHKDDSFVRQAWELAQFAAHSARPFSMTGTERLLQAKGEDVSTFSALMAAALRHPGEVVRGNLGFQPAPSYIQNSPALTLARQYSHDNAPPGTRTQEETEKRNARYSVEDMYRTGNIDRKTIADYQKRGLLTGKQLGNAMLDARRDPLVGVARNLSVEQLLNVYDAADDKEKKVLRPVLVAKQPKILEESNPEKRQELKEAFQHAMHPQQQVVTPTHAGIL